MRGAAAVVVVVVCAGSCASVDDHLRAGRLDAACHLLHKDPGLAFWRDPLLEGDALTAAVQERVQAKLVAVDDVAALLGEPLGEGGAAALAIFELSASGPIVVHELTSPSFLEGSDALAVLLAALPPLVDPAPPLLPPGPLEMPAAPDPTPPSSSSSSSRGSGGFFGAMFDLVTLPFRIVGDVVGALITIPLDLFGLRYAGASSSSSSSKPAEPRLPGEAILPPMAFQRVKEQREQDHAVALAAVAAARIERNRRLAPLLSSLSERCVATSTKPCRRAVLLTDTVAAVEASVGLGTPEAPCGLDDPIALRGLSLDVRSRAARAPPAQPPLRSPVDVAAVADAAAVFSARSAQPRVVDIVTDPVCRVEVRKRWTRLLPKASRADRQPSLSVRIATGSLVGEGVTVEVPAAPRFFVGSRGVLRRGDHLKLVVGTADGEGGRGGRDDRVGFLGGIVSDFDGALPLRVDGDSIVVECR